jgi:hypothetical protein
MTRDAKLLRGGEFIILPQGEENIQTQVAFMMQAELVLRDYGEGGPGRRVYRVLMDKHDILGRLKDQISTPPPSYDREIRVREERVEWKVQGVTFVPRFIDLSEEDIVMLMMIWPL